MFWSQPGTGTRDRDPETDSRKHAADGATRNDLSHILVLVAALAWCGNLATLSLGDLDSPWWRSLLAVWCLLILPALAVAWRHQRQVRLPAGGADLDVLTRTAERNDLSQNSGEIICTLREEIGRTLARQPGVVFAATLAGPGFHTGHQDNAHDRTKQGSFWCAGAAGPVGSVCHQPARHSSTLCAWMAIRCFTRVMGPSWPGSSSPRIWSVVVTAG